LSALQKRQFMAVTERTWCGITCAEMLRRVQLDTCVMGVITNNGLLCWSTEASKEPLLASFLHASILSHASFERSLAFHMANLLNSPAMISTQLQALFLEAFENSPEFRESLRQDLMAVMVRDPAVKSFTDVLLYFKGFQALQAHRVAHWLWKTGRVTLGTVYRMSRSVLLLLTFACFAQPYSYIAERTRCSISTSTPAPSWATVSSSTTVQAW
jgi:hypothetical protein